jgi:hypothetical protein
MARGTFNGPIDATFLPRRHWQLNEPLSFQSDEIERDEINFLRKHCDYVSSNGTVTAKAGTVTDLASIPRFAWTFVAPFEVARAAVLHDVLCITCGEKLDYVTDFEFEELRILTDKVFRLAMESSEPEIPSWKIKACYYAVRLFGTRAIKGTIRKQMDVEVLRERNRVKREHQEAESRHNDNWHNEGGAHH